MSKIFDLAFEKLLGHEGNFTDNPKDPGNWTGGLGKGELRGTKYGISAKSYPHLDIRNLTIEQAKEIYWRDFWYPFRCEDLPVPIAYLLFDANVNCGVGRGPRWLQGALGVTVDGLIGPKTIAAARRADEVPGKMVEFAIEFLRLRLFHHLSAAWADFGIGWARRLFRLPFEMMETTQWTR